MMLMKTWAKLIRAGYTKSDVKSDRANSWMLPSDVIVAVAATVVPSPVRDDGVVVDSIAASNAYAHGVAKG
eukprot:scaffold44250_cov234-Skeletonema_marinoi.AAC.1